MAEGEGATYDTLEEADEPTDFVCYHEKNGKMELARTPKEELAQAVYDIGVIAEGATHPVSHIMRPVTRSAYDFGWKHTDDLATRTAALKAAFASEWPLKLHGLDEYFMDIAAGGLLVPAGKIVEGNGALIGDETTHGKIITLVPGDVDLDTEMHAGGWQLGNLRIVGAYDGSTFNADGYGLYVAGSDRHGSGLAPIYVNGLEYEDLTFEKISNTAIFEQFVFLCRRSNVKVRTVGRSGTACLSILDARSRDYSVIGIGEGGGNSYAAIYTRDPIDPEDPDERRPLLTAPRSRDFVEDGWYVEDNPYWEAMDMHACEDGKFLNGKAKGVRRGINIGYDADGEDARGSINCEVRGNTVEGLALEDTANALPGLIIVGYADAEDGLTRGTISEGNTFVHCGRPGDPDSAGALVYGTRGTRMSGDRFIECASSGIHLATNNAGAIVAHESIDDTFADGLAAGIRVSGPNNDVTLGPNVFGKQASLSFSPASHQPYCYAFADDGTITVYMVGGDQRHGAGSMTLTAVGAAAVVHAATWTQINP